MVDFFVENSLGASDQIAVASSVATQSEDAAIARLASGGFVVVYVVNRAITVQRYDIDGVKIGLASVLTSGGSTTSNGQPSVTGVSGGGYVVSWVDSTTHVAAQVFDANGVATTSVFGVGTPSNYQQQPVVTALANGDFVVAWTFNSSASSIRAQVFNANGQAISAEIVATASAFSNSFYPQVAALTNGGFVLAWSSNFDFDGGATVRAQAFNSAGQAQGSAVRVANVVSFHDNFFESVAALPSGGYVLTWTESGDSGGAKSKVMGQIYAADGTTLGSRFQINTSGTYNAGQATVTAINGGGFLVTWKSDVPDGGPNYFQTGDIYAQLFDASAQKVGSEFLVNQVTASGQDLPIVTAFGTGDVAFLWRSFDTSGNETLVYRNLYSVTNGTDSAETIIGTEGVDYIRALNGENILTGLGGNDVLVGGLGNDNIDGGGGNDTIISDDGIDSLFGGAGDDGFVLGAFLTAADRIDGGAGTNDQVGITGNYTGANRLVLGATTLVDVEVLAVLPGGSYDIVINNGTVAAGTNFTVFGGNLGAGDNFTLDASAELDGNVITYGGLGTDTIVGGAGADGFYFGPGKYGATDSVRGGGGTNDQLALDGNYTLTLTAREDVEVFVMLRGPAATPNTFNVTVADNWTPAGQQRTIFGTAVTTNIIANGAAETDGTLRFFSGTGNDTLTGGAGNDYFFGNLGADTMTGGGGADIFVYNGANESTGTRHDRLVGLTNGVDKIDLPGVIGGIAANVSSGALSTASFNANLAAAIGAGQMGAGQAVLFTPTSGTLAGTVFLIADANGIAGYQADQDFVFRLDSPPPVITTDLFV